MITRETQILGFVAATVFPRANMLDVKNWKRRNFLRKPAKFATISRALADLQSQSPVRYSRA